jgi:hypothetical protein
MAPVPTTRLPGSMTVPPLFGWENIFIVLLLLIAVAVAFFVASAIGTGTEGKSDWQASLDARSRKRLDLGTESVDDAAEPHRSELHP